MKKNDLYITNRVFVIYFIYIFASFISFVYSILTGTFNGDFLDVPVLISFEKMVAILFMVTFPPIFVLWFANLIKSINPYYVYDLSQKSLIILLLTVLFPHIFVTWFYGVGISDQEVYSAPAAIQFFIQILNRIDPYYVGAFFILMSRKAVRIDLIAILLMLIIAYLRAGFGAINYIAIAMFIKYSDEIISVVKQKPWLALTGVFVLPIFVAQLYQIRNMLRGFIVDNESIYEVFFGRFIGRLSSYSNVAYIEQNRYFFDWSALSLERFYYFKQAMQSILGAGFSPTITPEKLLISGANSYDGFSSYMTGVPGNLIMAWALSPSVAALNLVFTIAMVALVLWLSRYLGRGATFGLAMLVYPLTSGVAGEFSLLLFNVFVIVVFATIFGQRRFLN
jgi:hypothetical protein